MATYRRIVTPGAVYFFTLSTYRRQPLLTRPEVLRALREAADEVRDALPFESIAGVILPDHLHAIWRLPAGDGDYASRWGRIKRAVSRRVRHLVRVPPRRSMRARAESGLWQRRFREHRIRDERDLRRHVDYIHFNPVRHGHVERVADWPHSSFHRYVAGGALAHDWAAPPDAVDGCGPDG